MGMITREQHSDQLVATALGSIFGGTPVIAAIVTITLLVWILSRRYFKLKTNIAYGGFHVETGHPFMLREGGEIIGLNRQYLENDYSLVSTTNEIECTLDSGYVIESLLPEIAVNSEAIDATGDERSEGKVKIFDISQSTVDKISGHFTSSSAACEQVQGVNVTLALSIARDCEMSLLCERTPNSTTAQILAAVTVKQQGIQSTPS